MSLLSNSFWYCISHALCLIILAQGYPAALPEYVTNTAQSKVQHDGSRLSAALEAESAIFETARWQKRRNVKQDTERMTKKKKKCDAKAAKRQKGERPKRTGRDDHPKVRATVLFALVATAQGLRQPATKKYITLKGKPLLQMKSFILNGSPLF